MGLGAKLHHSVNARLHNAHACRSLAVKPQPLVASAAGLAPEPTRYVGTTTSTIAPMRAPLEYHSCPPKATKKELKLTYFVSQAQGAGDRPWVQMVGATYCIVPERGGGLVGANGRLAKLQKQ